MNGKENHFMPRSKNIVCSSDFVDILKLLYLNSNCVLRAILYKYDKKLQVGYMILREN